MKVRFAQLQVNDELICCFLRLWDPKIEEKITQDRIGMNLLYVQVRVSK